jgi:ligand-binding sensor domain-containing protein/signal transduction histidine kinase
MYYRLSGIFYYFFLIFLLAQTDAHSQPYYFRHYQVENGLSNNSVYFIRQDSKGFMWIATKDGLDRFDGMHFKVFRIDSSQNAKHLSTDYIYCIEPRKNGWLWVGSQRGLYQYNPEKERLEPFIDSLKNIYDITIDRKGQMWFISSFTACRYNFKTKTLQQYPTSTYFSATSLCLAKDGNIWVGTQNGFLEKYNPDDNSFSAFDLFSHSKTPNSKWIQKIHGCDSNQIFAGTTSQGLKIFNTRDTSYEDVLTYNPDKTAIFVREILQNSNNEYWIATESGIFIYHTDTKTFTNLKKKFQDPYSLNDNAVYTLFKDNEGGIWAGTFFGGVNYYVKQDAAFKKYFPYNGENSISGNAVREICEDKYGNLWIGTEDGALNKINTITGNIEHFKPTGQKGGIAYTNVHGLLADGDDLWIGTFEHGIDLMDIKTGIVKRHYSAGHGEKGLESNFALCFIRASDGKIIIGTSNGLYYYDRKKDNFNRYPQVPEGVFVTSVIEDHNKIIWAGTQNDGAYWIDPAKNSYGNLQNKIDIKNTLSNNSINDIYEDSDHNIWFATEGGGISKLDSARKNFSYFNTANGLPGNFVFKIIEDDENSMWATTSKGLINFGPHFQNPIVYTRSNGLLTNQFNYHSGFKDQNGRLYFGCVKGMISFSPTDLAKMRSSPRLYITGVQVFNTELNPYKDSAELEESIIDTKKITLPYYQSSISFDFAALSYLSPEMIEYKYRLVGLDDTWTSLKTNRKVYFTNLSPGTYLFKIMASVNGLWDAKNTKELSIVITPPIWATWWAYLIYIISALTLLFYFIRSYQRTQHEKKEKEIYETKIDFFTNVAHEIRTPLTLIKGPVENLLEKRYEMPDMEEDLDCLDKNTNRLTQLISQILDFRQTEIKNFSLDFTKISINETLKGTFLRFKILAQKRKLDFELVLPSTEIHAMADAEALQKILSNLVGNAVKYSEKKVSIKLLPLQKESNSFTMVFENDGYIVKKEMAEKIFEPFYRIKETTYQKGTGIGLALARSLTQLHKGSLEMAFMQSNLNTFVLTLPLEPEQAHPKIAMKTQIVNK